jgi:histidyl-tRNA synthetase
MSEKIKAIRGMNDILPSESSNWLFFEKLFSDLLISFGYKNIRTPIVESTSTFKRAIGEVTDIVEKEMYTWQDNNGDLLTLRPEGTAGCVRAMIEHNLPREGIQKVFYSGPMFRHERPQKGRYRQFHQIGVEVFGSIASKTDAELLMITHQLWKKLGLNNVTLEINSLGSDISRQNFKEALVDYFSKFEDKLDQDSKRRLHTNPLRILDSKNPDIQDIINNAPSLIDYLDEDSNLHFIELQNYLASLEIPFKINPRLVRGLDYYNRTVFEWTTNDLGSQGTICAGGRYDGLVEKMGGTDTPAAGFALGVERLLLLLKEQNKLVDNKATSIYIVTDGDKANEKSLSISLLLNEQFDNLVIYNDLSNSSFKAQFKKANKNNVDYALVIGEDELLSNIYSLKPMKSSDEQLKLNESELISYIAKQI